MNVLIVGANSYIGDSFCSWVKRKNIQDVNITILDAKGEKWRTFDYQPYEIIYYVTGIAHIKETDENKNLYYQVNRDLTIQIAKCAKQAGVKQFIVLSTMSVYGKTTGVISASDLERPVTHYGKSKYEADLVLRKMNCDSFRVAILRPPMVYGKGCKGNYQLLRKFSLKIPVFPQVKNQRSMIFIDNLSSFVYYLMKKQYSGTFFPQNDHYVCTSTMVREISKVHQKRIVMIPGLSGLMRLVPIHLFDKVFGDLVYERISYPDFENDKKEFTETIRLTEGEI